MDILPLLLQMASQNTTSTVIIVSQFSYRRSRFGDPKFRVETLNDLTSLVDGLVTHVFGWTIHFVSLKEVCDSWSFPLCDSQFILLDSIMFRVEDRLVAELFILNKWRGTGVVLHQVKVFIGFFSYLR